MEFFNSAVDVLKTLVVALGAGLGVWGAVNLMEGYGGDNPSAKSQGMKQLMAIGGLLIGCAADLLNFVIPTNIYTFIVLVTIGYVALAIPNGVTWAFVSDVIDYSEWHNGIRKEGITYAAFNFSRKIAQALAAVVSSGILVLTGYVANAVQSEMTLMGIKAAMTLYPGVALGIAAIILYFFYGLTDDKFKKIADDLNHGKWEHGTIE